jgi:hypothetical protein
MGIHHEDGYSASVEGFFVIEQQRIRLAKTNGCTFVVAQPCQVPAGTEGEMLVIVDGNEHSRRVRLPDGIIAGQTLVKYEVSVPF